MANPYIPLNKSWIISSTTGIYSTILKPKAKINIRVMITTVRIFRINRPTAPNCCKKSSIKSLYSKINDLSNRFNIARLSGWNDLS